MEQGTLERKLSSPHAQPFFLQSSSGKLSNNKVQIVTELFEQRPSRMSHQPASAETESQDSPSSTPSHSAYFSYPVAATVSGLLRRLSSEPSTARSRSRSPSSRTPKKSATTNVAAAAMNGSLYTPPQPRSASPFQPPPLTPLTLSGWKPSTRESARLLSKALAEEVRLLFPPRNQLVDKWVLIYSLDQDGSSLATLYKKADAYRGKRGGFVLVVRDGSGNVFGGYLSDPPHPAPNFYGNGECFLWRASVLPSMPTLASLPPPPSEDTTHAQRMTTLAHPKQRLQTPPGSGRSTRSGTATPERIRFKAFPYSGENDYMIFCEQGFLSIGGGYVVSVEC